MKDLVAHIVRAWRGLAAPASAGSEVESPSWLGATADQAGLAQRGATRATHAGESLIPCVEMQFSPVVALFVRSQSRTIIWPLPSGQPISLGSLLRQVEQQAPESLMEPDSPRLRPHIRVAINGRAGVGPEHQVNAGDVVWIGMRLLEGG
jgi:hypothetical protein